VKFFLNLKNINGSFNGILRRIWGKHVEVCNIKLTKIKPTKPVLILFGKQRRKHV
jgi:hypothetical protein